MENDVYGEIINCDQMHFAEVTADTEETYTAGKPEYLAPAAEVVHDNAVTLNKRYYDGKLRYIHADNGDSKVTIVVSGIPVKEAAKLTGQAFDSVKGIMYDTGNVVPPWFALSGRMELGGGDFRYFQYLKGKFTVGAQTGHTKEEKVNPNTTTLTFTAAVTIHEFQVDEGKKSGVRSCFADTTETAFTAEDTWFTKVQTPDEPAA